MGRSDFTVDRSAIRANARRLVDVLDGAELWAVVKANGYGHGAEDASRAALEGGATALCVASTVEALELRSAFPETRIVVLGPTEPAAVAVAQAARLELVVTDGRVPEDIPVHLKLDTGMGRWGLSELPAPTRDVVGLMSHFAAAESDAEFTRVQFERFLAASESHATLTRHIANSAAALAVPESRLDAARCGIALYGISPFGGVPAAHGLTPALRWESALAQVKLLQAGESTGYGRTFLAAAPTWIGIVPVGYADGFRRDLTGTEVIVAGDRCRVVGTVSMDAFAVRLEAELPVGEPVTILGDGILAEEHAAIAETIAYEIVCGVNTRAPRAARRVVESP
jgi:alanine racemase